jgi:hypothetical protein
LQVVFTPHISLLRERVGDEPEIIENIRAFLRGWLLGKTAVLSDSKLDFLFVS